ncbi:MAG: HEAT repeat domain-containing protein [Planctomycetota bacterium]|jgi:HEAT repeat protein
MKLTSIFFLSLLLIVFLSVRVFGGEPPPPDKPTPGKGQDPPPDNPKPGKGEDPPAEEPKAKADPKLLARLAKIKSAISGKNTEAQYKAVSDLLSIDCPEDPEVIKEIVNTLVLAVNSLRGEPRRKCATLFCEMGRRFPKEGIAEKIKAVTRFIERKEGKNADLKVCLSFFDYLLEAEDPDGEKIVAGFLAHLKDHQGVFQLLLKYTRKGTLQILADIANDSKSKNLIRRREAALCLGEWGQGPPLYQARVPALLQALKSPVTSGEALKALQKICLPDHTKPSSWKRWWDRYEKEGFGDLEIIREDFKDAYERRRSKDEKAEGATAIAEWVRTWNRPDFRWALPVLIDPLLKASYNDKELRSRVITILGSIGEISALEPLGKLLEAIKGTQKRSERAILADLIKNMAKIAGTGSPEIRKKTGESLRPFLKNLFEGVVEAAAEAMGSLKYREAWETLVTVMKTTTKQRAAIKAAEALGVMQEKRALDEMLVLMAKCMQEKDYAKTSIAYHIVKALRSMNVRSPEVVSHLIQAIGCPDERVALEAITVLGADWKEPQAVPPIRLFFEDEKRNLAARLKAIKAIAAYAPEFAAETLFIALRRPSTQLSKDYQDAIRGTNETAKKRLRDEIKAGYNFFEVAKEYFGKPGHVLADHLSELIAVAKDSNNNVEGRSLCVKWMGAPHVWDEKKCLGHLVNFMEAGEVKVVESARNVLKKHRSTEAMVALMNTLPSSAPPRPSWQDMQKLDVIRDFIFHSNMFNFEDPPKTPDFELNGKSWQNWWKKVKRKFKFHEPEEEKKKK